MTMGSTETLSLLDRVASGRSMIDGPAVVASHPIRLDIRARLGPAPLSGDPGQEPELDRVSGGAGGGAVGAGGVRSLLPVRTRISRLARGAQPAVLKVVSYAALGSSGGAGSLLRYITREGERPGLTETSLLIGGSAAIADVLQDWKALAPPPRRTFVTLEVTGRLTASEPGGDQPWATICEALAPDRDHAFAVSSDRADPARGPGSVRLLLVTALADRQGRRLQLGEDGRVALMERAAEAGLEDVTVGYRRTARTEEEIAARLDMLARLSLDGRVQVDGRGSAVSAAGRRALASRWIAAAEPGHKRRDVMHLALSTRAGTDPVAFERGVEAFLDETFAGHPRVIAIHGPDDIAGKRTKHVHAHVAVFMHGPNGKIRTSPAILHAWRHALAEALTEQGIATVATRRHDLAHAPAFQAKHARRAERDSNARQDENRVAAKRARHVAHPSRAEGRALARDAATAWEELVSSNTSGRTAETIYAELTVARFLAARMNGDHAKDAIMSLEKQIQTDAQDGRLAHPAAAALSTSFARIEATLTEPDDRAALNTVLARVLQLAEDARQARDEQDLNAADERTATGAAASGDTLVYTRSEQARGDALLDAVAASETSGREAYAAYRDRFDDLALAPWDAGRQADARAALVEVTLAEAKLNRAASAVALDAARGNTYLEALIDAQADDPDHDQALVRMRAYVRGAGLDALPEAEADAGLLSALKADGPSPTVATETKSVDRLITREHAIAALRAQADPDARVAYDPVGRDEHSDLVSSDAREAGVRRLLADTQASRTAISRLDNEVEQAFAGLEAAPSEDAQDHAKRLALDLERHEDLYRDRLALVALAAVQGDRDLDAAIDERGGEGLRGVRDHIRDHRLQDAPDPEAAVLAAVRDEACTPHQDARWARYEVLTYDEFRRTDQTLWKDHVRENAATGLHADDRKVHKIAEERRDGEGASADAREAANQESEGREAYDAYLRAHRQAQDRRLIDREVRDQTTKSTPGDRTEKQDRPDRPRTIDEPEM